MPVENKPGNSEVIGLIPAAGQAKRLALDAGSKEMIRIPLYHTPDRLDADFQPVSQFLVEKYRHSGISRIFFILRPGKWDIPEYFEDGSKFGVNIAYLVARYLYGPPFSLDTAYAHVSNCRVALGFPDILFRDRDAFVNLLRQLETQSCDVMLGLFPADRSDKVDMVAMDKQNRVREIVIKPGTSPLRHTWGIAVWNPSFTHFMHDYLAGGMHRHDDLEDIHIGNVLQAAISQGLDVRGQLVSQRPFVDIGTPDDLHLILRQGVLA